MKSAKLIPFTFDVKCVHCGEWMTNNSNGSYSWTKEDVLEKGIVKCFECGKEMKIKIPAKFLA